MADHRAEQIMAAVVTRLTGLATTGANVSRGRLYPLDQAKAYALTVSMGAASPAAEPNLAFQDVALDVLVTKHVKDASNQVDTMLNQIGLEVYQAMMSDRTLGLSFVQDVIWSGDTEPEMDGEGNRPTARQETTFSVRYRHSLTDPSA